MVQQWFSFHVPACFRVGQILFGIVLSLIMETQKYEKER